MASPCPLARVFLLLITGGARGRPMSSSFYATVAGSLFSLLLLLSLLARQATGVVLRQRLTACPPLKASCVGFGPYAKERPCHD